MKTKLLLVAIFVVAAGFWTYAQQQRETKPDPRVDKLLEQNEQILKNQAEIMKSLETIQGGLQVLRRRST